MAQMSAAPGTLILGSKTYTMTPLDNSEVDRFMNWVRAQHVADARMAARASAIPMTEGMSDDEKASIVVQNKAEEERMVDRAFDQVSGTGMGQGLVLATMCKPAGVARMLWQGIVQNHPTVTAADVLNDLGDVEGNPDPEKMTDALDMYDRLNGTGIHAKKNGNARIAEKRRQRRKKQKERRKQKV